MSKSKTETETKTAPGAAAAAALTLRDALHSQPVIEFPSSEGHTWLQMRMGRASRQWRGWDLEERAWEMWDRCFVDLDGDRPVRLVPAAEADRDPATRGPL